MSDYIRVLTTEEVYSAIHRAHPELKVYSSYSAPEGDQHNPSVGRMETAFYFMNRDFPIIEAKTTWDIDRSAPETRKNLTQTYWLCIGEKE